ncbi:MAG: alternative ribosome rescue aminoacyl-tRNA hydrolase ArfB [Planctomycetota bacterium]|nr:alternative ribosome rescue aminoacyl-tRNA hydrolase ArfB [Planctomycetota bacterium]
MNRKINIRDAELIFKFSRSSGPGGQNVNKVNTKVTLFFDAANCGSFSDVQKQQIFSRIGGRADKNGVIRIVSQKERTQGANRQAAIDKLVELLMDAVKSRAVRKKTIVPYGAKERRLEAKKRRSIIKMGRRTQND